jgi:LemA protein
VESGLAHRIGKLFAVVEAYPELKASESFSSLHRALVDVEDQLQNARRYYNAVVRDLNTRIQSFPDMLVAGLFRFQEREFFKLDSAAESAVPRFDLEPGL